MSRNYEKKSCRDGLRYLAGLLLVAAVHWPLTSLAELPQEMPLWDGVSQNSIRYAAGETVRNPQASETAPSKSNRVFSDVSIPTYAIHRPDRPNGIGLVICPGGGYRDVWLDREGHDLAIWLKQHGITSLVLKYRTNGTGDQAGRAYAWAEYVPQVIADERQAVRVLRSQARGLRLDTDKIGICGFSAGGNLALQVVLGRGAGTDQDNANTSSDANFGGLFYPWLRDPDYGPWIEENQGQTPPLFIMNASDDKVTPADRCIEFYRKLLDAGVRTELHIVSKGGHGFDLGDGRGASAPLWKQSFIAWLKDAGFAE